MFDGSLIIIYFLSWSNGILNSDSSNSQKRGWTIRNSKAGIKLAEPALLQVLHEWRPSPPKDVIRWQTEQSKPK